MNFLTRRGWLLPAVLVLSLLVPELSLRAAGFEYVSSIQFAYPHPADMWAFQPDPDLFWRLKPFKAPPKRTGIARLLFLGDSCVWQGYPRKAVELLNAGGSPRFEETVFAVPGYSSHQGRILAEKYGAEVRPDVVFVSFGWNDHWLAYGEPDHLKQIRVPEGVLKTAHVLYSHSRFLQWFRIRMDEAAGKNHPIDEVRVPADKYRENLKAIARAFGNTPVVFLTAPTSFAQLGVPDELRAKPTVKSAEWLIAVHKEYNEAVREVTRLSGAYLLDMERESEALTPEEAEAIYQRDGIHFTEAGLVWFAGKIAEFTNSNQTFLGNAAGRNERTA